jgi:glycosyltransferase involved in cell wall biosynthesis
VNVALVHDWLTGMRGGERVLERIARRFPAAPIHTLVWKPGSVSRELESHPIRTSFLQRLPGAAERYRWFLPLYPRAIESFDLSGYDAVISTSHAVAKGAIVPAGVPHLCYVHTPMRYIWELESQYFPPERFPGPLGWAVRHTCGRLRAWDRATASRPTALVANSAHVADRIRRHWHREARVVHPGVDLARFTVGEDARDYYLLAGAMAPYKRLDLALAAFARLKRPLVVAGSGQDEARLRAIAPAHASFRPWLADGELAQLLAGAKALVFPGEEDFGLLPVEAMASGTPVIAYGRGGVLETVGRTLAPDALARVLGGGCARAPGGILFGTQTADAVAHAVEAFERERFDPWALRALAEPFSNERFDAEFDAALSRAWPAWLPGSAHGR